MPQPPTLKILPIEEVKSQAGGLAEGIATALSQQQEVLQEIVRGQSALKELMEERHAALLKKFSDVFQPTAEIQVAGIAETVPGGTHSYLHKHEQANNSHIPTESTIVENAQAEVGSATGEAEKAEEPQNDEEDDEAKKAERMARMQLLGRGNSLVVTPEPNPIKRFILGPKFEGMMGITIVGNLVMMLVILQWKGYAEGHKLGLREDPGWSDVKDLFIVLEAMFTFIFLVELLLRLWASGMDFFRHVYNLVDAAIVAGSLLNYLFTAAASLQNFTVVRVIRIFRLFRLTHFLTYAQHFQEMRILIHSIRVAVHSLNWSILILFGVVSSGGVLVVQFVHSFMEEASLNGEQRLFLYNNFGTASRGIYTMFECTFTSAWPFYSRFLIEEVSTPLFTVFWVAYVLGVNFMVMKVVGSLFLRQTLAVAASDEQRIFERDKRTQRHEFAESLRYIFSQIDTSGDGKLSKAEFDVCLKDRPDIYVHFEALDLDVDEVIALFDVLCEGDGVADYEEFLEGALKMKDGARVIDTVQIFHHVLKTRRDISSILSLLVAKITDSAPREAAAGHPEAGAHKGFDSMIF